MPDTPDSHGDSVVVLADARTDTERKLIGGWAQSAHPGAQIVDSDDPGLGRRLGMDADPLLVPARVTWLPRDRNGDRRAHPSDVLALTNPWRPWAPLQKLIAAREPDRAPVTVGEAARFTELRRSYEESGRNGGDAGLAAYTAQRTVIACERAQRGLVGDRYKVPRLVAEQITASGRFRDRVAALAARLGRPADDVVCDVEACLREFVAVQSPLAIDIFRALMRPMYARAWNIRADTENLDRLRELNRRYALVFLPSHRSYVDPLVLAEVLDEHDFPRNHLVGGDNLRFWPIGAIAKRAGVIFVRRSFGEDQVYKFAIAEYFGHLMSRRFNLEWFIEGGRTRTGKLRPPRCGLLRYLVRSLESGQAEDAMLVPVSIVYDQLPEAGAMAAEQVGADKPREGLRWLARYARRQRRDAGAAHIRFGEPFSLREALGGAGEGRVGLEKVAFRVCDGISRATPVTGPSLVTFALLGARDRALTFDEVARVVAPLVDYAERRGVPGPTARLRDDEGLRDALERLVEAGVAGCYDGGTEPVWWIPGGRHRVAAFYRNGALHHLVNRAIVELVLLDACGEERFADPVGAAMEDALGLRDLLKFEFFFADKEIFGEQLKRELELLEPGWRERVDSPDTASALLRQSHMLVAHRALRSFFDAQLVVARLLAARDPWTEFDRDSFLGECLGVGRQMLLQGRHGGESVSKELYGGALSLAENRGLLDTDQQGLDQARAEFLAEIEDVVTRVARIGEIDARLVEEALVDKAR